MKRKKEVVKKVKTIMSLAQQEAKNNADRELKPEHIILSMLGEESNKSYEVMKHIGLDTIKLYDIINEHLRHTQLNTSVSDIKRIRLPLDNDSNKVMKGVDSESEKMNDLYIDTTHIMLSLLKQKDLKLVKLLNKNGLTYDVFKKGIIDFYQNGYGLSEGLENEVEKFINKEMENDMENLNEDYDFNNSLPFDDDDDSLSSKSNKMKKGKKQASKTPVLDNFCRDISKVAEEGSLDPVVGRGSEIKRVSQILARRKKNNPILIGDPGVGKTAIVEGLAMLIKESKAPRILLDKKIFSLDLAAMVAGTKYRGQFEERIKAVLEELKENKDIILFIDEIHTIVGAGNATGSMDAANIFKPALARGEIQVIGATTLDEFRENIEKDGALTRRFQQVIVDEPTLDETITILNNIKSRYEEHHKVEYTAEAIEECVKLSDRYVMDRSMPDKAIDVLDEAGATTNINHEAPENIKKLEEEKELIKKRKFEVVSKQKYEEAAKLRDEEKNVNSKLDAAKAEWLDSIDKTRTVVDVDLVAEVVSMMSGVPLNKISSQETKRLMSMDKELTGKVIGQDDAVDKVVKAIKRNRLGIKDKTKPIGSFIFLGPTGVGKTYLAKLLAEHIFGDSDSLVRVDMSEYMEKHATSRLIGPPPGYVGYEEGGQLTEKIRRKPYSVILFDEIEKAHDDVFNLLLQLLDEGQLTDGLGRKVNFKNTLIILTSNIGVKELNTFGKDMGFKTNATIANEEEKVRSIIEKALKKKFKPEFLNRLDDTIVFNSLKKEDIHKIIQFYKRFGFKHNKGQYKSFQFRETMIRYPKLNEMVNEDKIKGGLADKLTKKEIANKFNIEVDDIEKQLEMGIKVEMEHTSDKKMSEEIAMDHLAEIPDYYTRLAKMEKEGLAYWKDKQKNNIDESFKLIIKSKLRKLI
jgi:ATP-dependent Clp protease ATP-binding subunit ClpC